MKTLLIPLLTAVALLSGCKHVEVYPSVEVEVPVGGHRHNHHGVVYVHHHEGHHHNHTHHDYHPDRVVVISRPPVVEHHTTHIYKVPPGHREPHMHPPRQQPHDRGRSHHDRDHKRNDNSKIQLPPGPRKPPVEKRKEPREHHHQNNNRAERTGHRHARVIPGQTKGDGRGKRVKELHDQRRERVKSQIAKQTQRTSHEQVKVVKAEAEKEIAMRRDKRLKQEHRR